MTDYGLDYSAGRPSGAAIKGQGYNFVMRYLNFPGQQHAYLTVSELADLKANGVHVGLIWETAANRAAQGWQAGVDDGNAAQAQANILNEPGATIYATIDFDASEAQQAAINAYFDGFASIIGVGRLGAYGGYWPLSRLKAAGKATYFWQTVAWSGGNALEGRNLFQDTGVVYVAGIDCDKNERYSYSGLIGEEGDNGVSSRDLYETLGVQGITENRNLFDSLNAFEGGAADRFNRIEATLQAIIQQLNNLRTGGTEGTPLVTDVLATEVADKVIKALDSDGDGKVSLT